MHTQRFLLLIAALYSLSSTLWGQDKSGSREGLSKSSGESAQVSTGGNKGANQFSLPFPDLPRRAGFGPSISLAYDQQTRGGLGFGKGWMLSVPAIEVSSDDGLPLAGSLSSGEFKNRWTYQGEKLLFVRAEGERIIYRPRAAEQELIAIYHKTPYTLPQSQSLEIGMRTVSPSIEQGFEIIHADGSRELYSADLQEAEGFTAGNAQSISRMPLVFEISKTGETTHYSYIKVDGRSYLTDVYFSGGKSHYHLETMTSRTSQVQFDKGFEQRNSALYSKLEARFGNEVLAQWCFTYLSHDPSPGQGRTIETHAACKTEANSDLAAEAAKSSLSIQDELTLIYRYGNQKQYSSDAPHFPAVRLGYSAWDSNALATRDTVYSLNNLLSGNNFSAKNFELADVNHDSIIDIIRSVGSNQSSEIYLGNGRDGKFFDDGKFWTLQRGAGREESPDMSSPSFHFADLDGDSLIDILQWEGSQAHVYQGQPDGRFLYSGLQNPTSDKSLGASSFTDGKAQFIDIDGDGKSDVLTTTLDERGHTVWKLYLNLSRTVRGRFELTFAPKTFRFPFPDARISMADRNFRISDFNGDNLPDVSFSMASPEDGKSGICVYLNRGQLFVAGRDSNLFGDGSSEARCGNGGSWMALAGMPGVSNLDNIWISDVNGDGFQDVASIGQTPNDLLVWLGLGDLQLAAQAMHLPLNKAIRSGRATNVRSRIADIDGDGQSEILIFNEGAPADEQALMIDFNRDDSLQLIKSNLLTSVAFESGIRYDMRYATAASERLRDKRLGEVTSPLHFPLYVIKQLIQSIKVPGKDKKEVQVQEFFYQQPSYSAEDREFLGFGKVAVLSLSLIHI